MKLLKKGPATCIIFVTNPSNLIHDIQSFDEENIVFRQLCPILDDGHPKRALAHTSTTAQLLLGLMNAIVR